MNQEKSISMSKNNYWYIKKMKTGQTDQNTLQGLKWKWESEVTYIIRHAHKMSNVKFCEAALVIYGHFWEEVHLK